MCEYTKKRLKKVQNRRASNKKLKKCYNASFFDIFLCRERKNIYLCNVFFIVLDLRLTILGSAEPFFYSGQETILAMPSCK